MNAMMRERDEAPVVANETIEVMLGSLRVGLDEVKEDIRDLKADVGSLRDKIDRNYETLSQGQTTLRDKLDSARSELIDRIDQVRTDLGNEFKEVRKELAATNVAVAKVGTMQKALLWVIGGSISLAGLTGAVLQVGTKFHWF